MVICLLTIFYLLMRAGFNMTESGETFSMAVIGDFSIGGTIMKADNLASTLQVCLDSGAKKVLLPQTSAVDLGTVPAELMSSFSLVFYQSAEDAVFKALGVE